MNGLLYLVVQALAFRRQNSWVRDPDELVYFARNLIRTEPPKVHPRRVCPPDRKTGGNRKPLHYPLPHPKNY